MHHRIINACSWKSNDTIIMLPSVSRGFFTTLSCYHADLFLSYCVPKTRRTWSFVYFPYLCLDQVVTMLRVQLQQPRSSSSSHHSFHVIMICNQPPNTIMLQLMTMCVSPGLPFCLFLMTALRDAWRQHHHWRSCYTQGIFLVLHHSQWHGDTFRHDYCADVTQTSRHVFLKYASCF